MLNSANLIDPLARTVTLVDRGDRNSLAPVYALLDCKYVDGYQLGDTGPDVLYVDEYQREGRGAFACSRIPAPLIVGRALWVGSTADGEEADPDTPLAIASRCIVFLEDD